MLNILLKMSKEESYWNEKIVSIYTKYLGFEIFYKSLYRSLDKTCSLESSCLSSESVYKKAKCLTMAYT